MSMNKRNKIILAIIGGIIVSGLYLSNFFDREIVEVKRGNLTEDISAYGEVVASKELSLSFGSNGVVKDVLVTVGDNVEAGDTLMSLDASGLEVELKKKEAEIDLIKASFSQFLAGARSEELKLFEAQVDSAKVDLENSLNNFENIKIKADNDIEQVYQSAADTADSVLLAAGNAMDVLNSIYQPSNRFQTFFFIPNFNKRSDAEWQIIFTRDAFDKIKESYDLLKSNPTEENIDKLISSFKINLEIIRLSLTKTSDALESASVVFGAKTIDQFKYGIATTRSEINSVQTDILNKSQAIDLQKILNETSIGEAENIVKLKRSLLLEKEGELALKKAEPRDTEIALFEAKIKEAEASKYLIIKKIENTHILAPVSGVIKSILIKNGENAFSGKPAVVIASISDFQIESEVLEPDAKKIKIGDDVDIYAELDGETNIIRGNIAFISDEKIERNDKFYTKVYIATREKAKLKLGEKTDLIIRATVKRASIVIPKRAIISKNDSNKVILFEDGTEREIDIKTGIESIDLIEVVSGLYAGDRIIIR